MTYQRLIVGDSTIVRFWQAAQLARPQLVGVALKPASCLDTLSSGLSDVTDELDYVVVSMLTSYLTEEASGIDVRASTLSLISDVVRVISATAKRAPRVEVCTEKSLIVSFL